MYYNTAKNLDPTLKLSGDEEHKIWALSSEMGEGKRGRGPR